MKFYIDTEFSEQPGSIKLISIGIISEWGDTFYAESSEIKKEDCNDWVQENVLPKLYFWGKTDAVEMIEVSPEKKIEAFSRTVIIQHAKVFGDSAAIKKQLLNWFDLCIQNRPIAGFEFWAYFADYDWVVFCWIFGRMIDLPEHFPKYCLDLKQEMHRSKLSGDWKREKCPDPINEHNALTDAVWNKKLHEEIMKHQGQERTIKSFVAVGDVIEVEEYGENRIYTVDQFEVIPNGVGARATEFVIQVKFSYNHGESSVQCTSDKFKYIRHISYINN